jgi:RNA polymerase sigma-70 factor, ECF subfamily
MLEEHEDPARATATAARDLDDAKTADDGLAAFVGARSRLFGIAYRVVGSSAEAEDVVQEVWLRWQATDRSVVLDAAAFLVTTTTRLAINAAVSARSRRETYLGPWLPEPIDTSADPELQISRSEALGLAIFLLLEKLTPTERAAYVLSHAFDYSHAQIAEMLQLSEANARQLASRAGKHLAAERRQHVRSAAQRRLLETFLGAARSGELTALQDLLVADVARGAERRTTRIRSSADRWRPVPRRASASEDGGAPLGDGSARSATRRFDLAS